MRTANPINNAVEVLSSYSMDGHFWLTTPCDGYDALKALPFALSFEGREYCRSGWNSDSNIAYYTTARKYAIK